MKEWYPPKQPANERLRWYAERFSYVELNSSFYAVPDRTNVHKWVNDTPDDFVFDVKVHRLLSRHSAPLDSLPPDLRDDAQTTDRGRVRLTPALETALADRLVEETAPMAEADKLGCYFVQLTPAFSPGRHELDELDRLVEAFAPHRVALELRHAAGCATSAANAPPLVCRPRCGLRGVDAPPGDQVPIMPSDFDAVTRDDLAYLRLHGRNTDGYLKGSRWPSAWLALRGRRLEEVAERASTMAEQAREVHVAFNNTAVTMPRRRPSDSELCSGRSRRVRISFGFERS